MELRCPLYPVRPQTVELCDEPLLAPAGICSNEMLISAELVASVFRRMACSSAELGERLAHPPLGAGASVERGVEVVAIIKAGKQSGS